MTDIFKIKKRGRKGEGRAVKFKALMLPEDIIEELKIYKDHYSMAESTQKDEYGNPLPARVSYEQMLRHWMDNIDAFDPEAYDAVQSMKEFRREHPVQQMYEVNPFDFPIEFNGDTFVCSEDYQDFKGRTLDEMYNQNWPLICDGGHEFTLEQAHELCRRLQKMYRRGTYPLKG